MINQSADFVARRALAVVGAALFTGICGLAVRLAEDETVIRELEARPSLRKYSVCVPQGDGTEYVCTIPSAPPLPADRGPGLLEPPLGAVPTG